MSATMITLEGCTWDWRKAVYEEGLGETPSMFVSVPGIKSDEHFTFRFTGSAAIKLRDWLNGKSIDIGREYVFDE